jgi:hypothetical protein
MAPGLFARTPLHEKTLSCLCQLITIREYTAGDDASAACQADNALLMKQGLTGWLDEVFGQ